MSIKPVHDLISGNKNFISKKRYFYKITLATTPWSLHWMAVWNSLKFPYQIQNLCLHRKRLLIPCVECISVTAIYSKFPVHTQLKLLCCYNMMETFLSCKKKNMNGIFQVCLLFVCVILFSFSCSCCPW